MAHVGCLGQWLFELNVSDIIITNWVAMRYVYGDIFFKC